MTPEQDKHLVRIQGRMSAILAMKYRKGAEEHGGNLWDSKILLQEALQEVADLATYLLTLEEQIGSGPLEVKPGVAKILEAGFETKPVRDVVQVVQDLNDPGLLYPHKSGDVGYDLIVSQDTMIPGLSHNMGLATTVPSAVKIKIPSGYYAQIVGRSSAANKRGILVHTATIDNGYTGQLFACCWNMAPIPTQVLKGERLAQVIFLPIATPMITEVYKLPETERGESGFGSTGH